MEYISQDTLVLIQDSYGHQPDLWNKYVDYLEEEYNSIMTCYTNLNCLLTGMPIHTQEYNKIGHDIISLIKEDIQHVFFDAFLEFIKSPTYDNLIKLFDILNRILPPYVYKVTTIKDIHNIEIEMFRCEMNTTNKLVIDYYNDHIKKSEINSTQLDIAICGKKDLPNIEMSETNLIRIRKIHYRLGMGLSNIAKMDYVEMEKSVSSKLWLLLEPEYIKFNDQNKDKLNMSNDVWYGHYLCCKNLVTWYIMEFYKACYTSNKQLNKIINTLVNQYGI